MKSEVPETSPHCYRYLILDKGDKTYTGEKTTSSMNSVGKN
jgi:hypothetical protein